MIPIRSQTPLPQLPDRALRTQVEVDELRSKGEQEKQQLEKDFKEREKSLVQEIEQLSAQVAREEGNVLTNRKMSNRILETRIELDKELSTLRKQYDADSKEWETALRSQQEMYNRHLQSSQRDFDQLQEQLTFMQAEYDSPVTNMEKLNNAKVMANRIFRNRADAKLAVEVERLQVGKTKAEEDRIKIENEMASLKRKYQHDLNDWKQTMTRELAGRDKSLAAQKEEYGRVYAELSKIQEERAMLDTEILLLKSQTEVLEATSAVELAEYTADREKLYTLLKQFQEDYIAMESELDLLKTKYENDRMEWNQTMTEEVSAREEDFAKQKAELEMLSAAIGKVKEERIETEDKLFKLSLVADQLALRDKELAEQKSQVLTLRAEVAKIKAESNETENKLARGEAAMLELAARDEEVAKQNEEIEKLRAEMAKLEAEMVEKDADSASLTKITDELAARDEELSKQKAEMEELRTDMAKMTDGELTTLTNELAARDTEVTKQQAELSKLQEALDQINEERADGELASLAKMTAELAARDEIEAKQLAELQELQAEITMLTEDAGVSVRDKIVARDQELTEQKEEIETLRAQLADMEKEKLAFSSELETEQAAENAELRTEVIVLKEEHAKMAIQLASLQKKYDEAVRDKESGDGVLFVENDRLAEQKAEIEKLRAEMAKIRVERNDTGALLGRAWGVMIGTTRKDES